MTKDKLGKYVAFNILIEKYVALLKSRRRLKYSAIEGPCVLILTELDLGRPKNGLSLLVILLILVFSQNFLKKIF